MPDEPANLQSPPWDWASLADSDWRSELDDLAQWVDWLQHAYRVVELPPCWPCHEGLRVELAFFWYWWQEFHLPRKVDGEEALTSAATGVTWHDCLRRAAESWSQRYGGCSHSGLEIDERKRPLDQLASARREFTQLAWKREIRRRRPDAGAGATEAR
jgi:hypothetical protein